MNICQHAKVYQSKEYNKNHSTRSLSPIKPLITNTVLHYQLVYSLVKLSYIISWTLCHHKAYLLMTLSYLIS